jgi:hypothetical protein
MRGLIDLNVAVTQDHVDQQRADRNQQMRCDFDVLAASLAGYPHATTYIDALA